MNFEEFCKKAVKDISKEIEDQLSNGDKFGDGDWVHPYRSDFHGDHLPINAISGKPYSGTNRVILTFRYDIKFERNIWLTYAQAKKLGGRVRKGERGSRVVFFKEYPPKNEDDQPRKVCRHYTVFNIGQCDDLPEKIAQSTPNYKQKIHIASSLEEVIESRGIELRYHTTDRIFFDGGNNSVNIPKFKEGWLSEEACYGSIMHELIHATGHKSRLNRDTLELGLKYGPPSDEYKIEELTAELGSWMLGGWLGVRASKVEMERTAQYIRFWGAKFHTTSFGPAFRRAAVESARAVDWLLTGSDSEQPGSQGVLF